MHRQKKTPQKHITTDAKQVLQSKLKKIYEKWCNSKKEKTADMMF